MNRIIYQKDLPCTHWSGGTTTQLAILPEGMTVKDDFQFRISSALVEKGESVFSYFKGYSRFLLILNGFLEIQHEGEDPLLLESFQEHFFPGDIYTQGICDDSVLDFNIIWKSELPKPKIHVDKYLRQIKVDFQNKTFIYHYSIDSDKCFLEISE